MTIHTKNHYKFDKLTPLHNNVFITDIEEGNRLTRGGVILLNDNMSHAGIRPRWGRVFAIGPDVIDIAVGEWVLVEHGRWTNRIDVTLDGEDLQLWRIDYPDAVMLATDEDPRLAQTTMGARV